MSTPGLTVPDVPDKCTLCMSTPGLTVTSMFRLAFLWGANKLFSTLIPMAKEELGPHIQKFRNDVEAHIQQVLTGNDLFCSVGKLM